MHKPFMKVILQLFLRSNKLTVLLFVIVASIPLVLPYFHSGYFPTHDGEWAVVRLGDMFRELKDQQIPARYSGNLNFGYGYPLFEFAYPLPYYIGILFHFIHINFVNSIKLLFLMSVPLSLFSMYLLGNEVWMSKRGGFLSAMLYVYFPYRLVDLYVRGSIGESLALAIFPFIAYFLFRLHREHRLIFSLSAGVCISILVMTHNIMAVEFLPVIILFIIFSLFTEKTNRVNLAIKYFFALLLGFGLSCFFWLPALSEKHLISLSVTPIADRSLYFVSFLQAMLPSWGYGVPPSPSAFSYQIGIPQILLIILLFVSFIIYKKMRIADQFLKLIFFSFSGLLFVYFLLLFSFTSVIWESLPLLKEINYPWTLLAVMGFLISFLSGHLTAWRRGRLFTVSITLLAVLYCLPYAHPSNYIDRGDPFYLTNDATTTSSDEYMPLWVKQKPLQRTYHKFVPSNKNVLINIQSSNSKQFYVQVQSTEPFVLRINTIYYPGWKTFIDSQNIPISYSNSQGVMQVYVPKGTHVVSGIFTETALRLFADVVTVVSVIVTIILFVYSWRKK